MKGLDKLILWDESEKLLNSPVCAKLGVFSTERNWGCPSSLIGLAKIGPSGEGSVYLQPWPPLKVEKPGSTWAGLEKDGASRELDPIFPELVDCEGKPGSTLFPCITWNKITLQHPLDEQTWKSNKHLARPVHLKPVSCSNLEKQTLV